MRTGTGTANLSARYACEEGVHLWVSAKQAAGGRCAEGELLISETRWVGVIQPTPAPTLPGGAHRGASSASTYLQ